MNDIEASITGIIRDELKNFFTNNSEYSESKKYEVVFDFYYPNNGTIRKRMDVIPSVGDLIELDVKVHDPLKSSFFDKTKTVLFYVKRRKLLLDRYDNISFEIFLDRTDI